MRRRIGAYVLAVVTAVSALLFVAGVPAAAVTFPVHLNPQTWATVSVHMTITRNSAGQIRLECGLHGGSWQKRLLACNLHNAAGTPLTTTASISPAGGKWQSTSGVASARSTYIGLNCNIRYGPGAKFDVNNIVGPEWSTYRVAGSPPLDLC